MSPRIASASWFLEGTGVGIFSLFDFLARWQIAQVSSDSGACNLDARDYRSQFGPTILRLWDTVRWREPEPMATKAPLKRVTVTTVQSNYASFHGVLGKKEHPIAFAIPHVDKEAGTGEWGTRSVKMLEKNGIVSAGHACITTLEGRQRYQQYSLAVQ
ncbi:hypothetical protein PAXINDRAFT_21437 [Paxillus involutus ATCC 200175]|uniref:Unplaced genomic scaffold PAXINscaffold_1768, whole genome shotgun sequence n=1 Tax=Paxillus involutus ATCC 200175 TaxID=664439 RepID=A0A0C9T193_PAXIN|nr:hypothetical protein PAXINDRAFT_21437 [Paxillus involutus ATCC 200175]